jgi:hypothetical protein
MPDDGPELGEMFKYQCDLIIRRAELMQALEARDGPRVEFLLQAGAKEGLWNLDEEWRLE